MVYIDEHIMDFDLDAALQQISEQRREQALRFKFERGQRTCVLAYILLKKALRQEYGIHENPIFEYNAHGKPSIIGHPDIHFNLSHCREAVACAVSPHPIGIDVHGTAFGLDKEAWHIDAFAVLDHEGGCEGMLLVRRVYLRVLDNLVCLH